MGVEKVLVHVDTTYLQYVLGVTLLPEPAPELSLDARDARERFRMQLSVRLRKLVPIEWHIGHNDVHAKITLLSDGTHTTHVLRVAPWRLPMVGM
ncbi:MAG: hypothetical protein ACOYOB_20075 [Myxococcota bacterium]